MYQALNPQDNRVYSIREWLLKSKFRNCKDGSLVVTPLCPVCYNELRIRPKAGGKRQEHFYHYKSNTNCPIVIGGSKKYTGLRTLGYNPENERKLKIDIAQNLYKIFMCCYKVCDNNLKYREFIEKINVCTLNEVWKYVDLQIKYVPYILLNLTSGKDKPYFFTFDPKIEYYNDLWINSKTEKILHKIYYKDSKVVSYNVNDEFLKYTFKIPDQFISCSPQMLKALNLYENDEEDMIIYWSQIKNNFLST